jgi:hypothetical protein
MGATDPTPRSSDPTMMINGEGRGDGGGDGIDARSAACEREGVRMQEGDAGVATSK